MKNGHENRLRERERRRGERRERRPLAINGRMTSLMVSIKYTVKQVHYNEKARANNGSGIGKHVRIVKSRFGEQN